MHYMLSAWWLHLLDRMGHYIIFLGAVEQNMVMTNNIMTFFYRYDKHRLKNTPCIFCKIAYIGWLIAWIP